MKQDRFVLHFPMPSGGCHSSHAEFLGRGHLQNPDVNRGHEPLPLRQLAIGNRQSEATHDKPALFPFWASPLPPPCTHRRPAPDAGEIPPVFVRRSRTAPPTARPRRPGGPPRIC